MKVTATMKPLELRRYLFHVILKRVRIQSSMMMTVANEFRKDKKINTMMNELDH